MAPEPGQEVEQQDHADDNSDRRGSSSSSGSSSSTGSSIFTDAFENVPEAEVRESYEWQVENISLEQQPSWVPDHTLKVLLVGDSGVGKTSLVLRYISDRFEDKVASTVGVDFLVKRLRLHDTAVKLTIWDTAGQERFRTLSASFFRGAKGIIFVFDVTRPETLSSLSDSWMPELEQYTPHPEVARIVVANKVDQAAARRVSWQQGADFAAAHHCLYCETSAKQNVAVGVAFEELVLRILQTPALLEEEQEQAASTGGARISLGAGEGAGQRNNAVSISCAC